MWETKFLAMTTKYLPISHQITCTKMSWNLYLANCPLCMLYNGVFKTHLRKLNTFWQLFLQYSWHEMNTLCVLYNGVFNRGVFKNHLKKLNTFQWLVLQYCWHEKKCHFMQTILKKELSKCIQFSQMGLEDSNRIVDKILMCSMEINKREWNPIPTIFYHYLSDSGFSLVSGSILRSYT